MIQSYLMTVSKYDFSVYEKRILYRLVEAMQCEIEGKKLYPTSPSGRCFVTEQADSNTTLIRQNAGARREPVRTCGQIV